MSKIPIVIGVTGSGKTDFSFRNFSGEGFEFINIDTAQFFSFVSVGTARPSDSDFNCRKSHFFGFLDDKTEFNSFCFVSFLEETLKNILNSGGSPVIVGGSHFYVYSLFFKLDISEKKNFYFSDDFDFSWDALSSVSPERAKLLHPNDLFRIKNSIISFYTNGSIPKLNFSPAFDYVILEKLPKDGFLVSLKDRISNFFYSGFLFEEILSLSEEKMDFLKKKKIIGYEEIIDFIVLYKKKINISHDELKSELYKNVDFFVESIYLKTLRYVKKQKKFIKKLKRELVERSIEWIEV